MYDGVSCGNGHVNRIVCFKRLDNTVNDAVAYKRTHGIMEYQTAVRVIGIGINGCQTGFITLLAATKNLLDFFPFVAYNHGLNLTAKSRICDNGNFIYLRVVVKHVYSMFNDSLACHLEELFWGSQS